MITKKLLLICFILFVNICYSKINQNPNNSVVIELFTSQGCSSCPTADGVLKNVKIYGENENLNIFPLSFNITYWDKLGWKDTYGKDIFNERQVAYAEKFKINIYTPQAIINGYFNCVGSDNNAIVKQIEEELTKENKEINDIIMTIKENKINYIEINYEVKTEMKDYLINFALLSSYEEVDVLKGENKGKKTIHPNVVLDFKTTDEKYAKGDVYFDFKKNKYSGKFLIIAYLQDKESYRIFNAKKINFE